MASQGVRIGVKVDDRAMKNMLKRGTTAAPMIFAQALTGEAQLMLRDAVNVAPWRSRTLRKSATILPAAVVGTRVTLKFGFGGAASKYAEIQHDKFPNKVKAGTQWHYLLEPVAARAGSAGPRISARMENLLKG